jgi:hypothetical protein
MYDPDAANEQVLQGAAGPTDRHVVHDLANAVRVQEACDENVCIGPIVLLLPDVVAGRRNSKMPTLLVVENGREDARRIKARHTHPVDRAVYADQCGSVQITY